MKRAAAQGTERLPFWTALTFSATSLPVQAVAIALAVYLPRHYASHLGVNLAVVGSAFFIVRAIDIPIDALLGWSMDKTRTPFGRYRIWTVVGAPILMAGVYFLFQAPAGVDRTYLIVWLLCLYLGNSILTLSLVAWAARLAPNYDDRSRLFGIVTAIGVLGAASVLAIPIFNDVRHASDVGNVPTMGWLIFGLVPAAVALVIWRTPEKISPDAGDHSFRLRDYGALVVRPSFARLILADLCLALGPGWMSAIYLFFFTDSRGFTTGQASILLAIYILTGIVGAPLLGRLAMKLSKHRAVMIASSLYSVILISLIALPKGQLAIAAIPMFFLGVMASGFNVLTRAMTADIADEIRLEQGRERAGLLYAITTMTTKVAGAFSIGLTFFVLSSVGYDAADGAVNSAHAVRNLELVYLVGPVIFVMLGGACMVGYRLDAARHDDIRRQLDERDALYTEAPVIESVTAEAAAVTLRRVK
ncbi:MFS transporter [Phenylobacterium sp.]|uniref:MFS transporter n=1 Tax=Phenylobacterium sp. TaxID=1871053 RepID=UPI0035B2576B